MDATWQLQTAEDEVEGERATAGVMARRGGAVGTVVRPKKSIDIDGGGGGMLGSFDSINGIKRGRRRSEGGA